MDLKRLEEIEGNDSICESASEQWWKDAATEACAALREALGLLRRGCGGGRNDGVPNHRRAR